MKHIIIFKLALILGFGIVNAQDNQLTDKEKKEGWMLLFDGKTTNGWRNYRSNTIKPQWQVANGALTLTAKEGGDIVTNEEFENFELSLEWKISDCGNSGLFYYVKEDTASWAWAVYATGPEMQILDDKCHPDNKLESHRAGALYDMISCSGVTVKPAGEWNKITLKINNGKAEHWQNGKMVVSYTLWDENWKKMVAASKFGSWKGFAAYKKGRFALQDHGDVVSFKNIKVRKL
ncbi:MAG: DUF1080 domain-containing protein [Bacteroidota bacterium]|nr:DUF1080 domain-containing protein [Bacteroidota bacterium]